MQVPLRRHARQPLDHHALVRAGGVPGQQRDPVPRRHERLRDAGVAEALHHARGRAHGLLDVEEDPVEGQALRHADPRLAAEVGRAHRRTPGEAVVRGHRHVERLHHERHDHEAETAPRAGARERVGDDHVEVGGEVGEGAGRRIPVARPQREVGDPGDPVEEAGQQHLRRGGERGEGDLAGRLVPEVLPQGLGTRHGDRDVGRRAGEGSTGVGQHDPSPRALRERHAGLALEHLELLRDGGRGPAGGARDGADAAAVGELAEELQATDVHEGRLHNQARTMSLS